MEHTQQQWHQLQQEVLRLRKQNQQLKKLLKLQLHPPEQALCHQSHHRQFMSYKETDHNHDNQLRIPAVHRSSIMSTKTVDELKKQWAQWSNQLEASIVSKNSRFRHNTEIQDLRRTTTFSGLSGGSQGAGQGFYVRKSLESMKSGKGSEQFINLELKSPGKSELVIDQKLDLIEDIFLFGPSVPDIQKSQQRKFIAGHQLYYPQSQKQAFQVYGNYLFPNELEVKHIRQKNHALQVNKMIFKNNKKLDCNVFIFQGQFDSEKIKKPNKILQKINPSKWMYALSIEFSDFVSVRNEKISSSKINKTYSMVSQFGDKNDRYVDGDNLITKDQMMFGTGSKKNIELEEELFKSNFCLCIMTYFPFIRFLKDILMEVFDSVKLKRMNKHNNCSGYKQLDIYFFIEQLKVELAKFLQQKLKVQPILNQLYEFPINQVPMKLDLKESNLLNEILADWAFKILKIMDKDALLDIFCYIMLEESVFFVCEDRQILTYVILLYIVLFTLPFGYPHPCVSVIFDENFLQSPFTIVLGINKSTKWLEENLQSLNQNRQNKILVNLNEEEVKIKFKKKPRTYKTERLKKIFFSFYRKIQTSSIPILFKKKIELLSRQSTKQQNQHVSTFFMQLHQYYQEELLNHLPNTEIINLIKQSFQSNGFGCGEENPNVVYNVVIQKIEKYLAESRKAKCKDRDTFIQEIIKKQLFRIFIDNKYHIQ